MLQHITISQFTTTSGKTFDIPLSYETFGPELHSAPIVLVNHALTGNSSVSGENGWWKTLVGKEKVINTERFTVLCFNVPGNGYDGFLVENFIDFTAKDIARIFLKGLQQLNISKLHTIIGGSVGGSIGWEMLALEKNLANQFIPIASDYKTTDWLYSQCLVQQFLLNSGQDALQKSRIHAMLCYRTPQSINERFQLERSENSDLRKSHDWLNYHGNALNERFSLKAYQLMNQLLMTINVSDDDLKSIDAEIHLIAVDSDLFFPAFEIRKCFGLLKKEKSNIFYHEINSVHGHDAFLMEYEQLNSILNLCLNEK